MKLRFPPPVVSAVSLALLQPSCMMTEPSGDGGRPAAGYPEEGADWNSGLRAVWKAGFDSGLRDSVEGFRFNDDRGAQRLAGRERDIFRRGYRSGYYSRSRRSSGGGGASPPDGRRDEPGGTGAEEDSSAGVPRTASPWNEVQE